jgi:hypothetical protein
MHGKHHDGAEQDEQGIRALFVCVHNYFPWMLNFFGAKTRYFGELHLMYAKNAPNQVVRGALSHGEEPGGRYTQSHAACAKGWKARFRYKRIATE